jgi:hypothetical protein
MIPPRKQLPPPESVVRRVVGVTDIANVTIGGGSKPVEAPSSWLYGVPSPFGFVLVTAPAGNVNAGIWRWDDMDEWLRPNGFGGADRIPNGYTAYFADAAGVYEEWLLFTNASLDAFVPDTDTIFSQRRGSLSETVEVLNVSGGNAVGALSRAPIDPKAVTIYLPNGLVFYSSNAHASGAFSLGGSGNQSVTWNASVFDLAAAGITNVIAKYRGT